MKTKFGIIGCGFIANFHAPGLEKAGAQVVHVSDINEASGKALAERFGAKFSKDYSDVIADPEVTAVIILTGSFLHKEIAIAALEAGKDVVCEKTLTISAKEAEELAKKSISTDRIFVSALMKRFFPATVKAKELMKQIGKPFSAQVRAYHQWGNLYEEALVSQVKINDLSGVVKRNGSLVLMCSGSHMLDMMMNIMGRPESVYANMDYIENTNVERRASALFEYENHASVYFEAAANPLMKIGYERNGFDEYIKVMGTEGSIELYTVTWDKPENNGLLLIHYDEKTGTSTEYRFEPINAFDLEVQAYCEAIENRTPIQPDVIDGFNVDNVIGAMFESAEKGSKVKIDWKGL